MELLYDNHYCRYFEKESSYWTLEFSDDFITDMGTSGKVSVDGEVLSGVLGLKQILDIPAGLGTHEIEFLNK